MSNKIYPIGIQNFEVLNSIDSESANPIPVIYQSEYLTIKGYDERFGMYHLGFPNREVEEVCPFPASFLCECK